MFSYYASAEAKLWVAEYFDSTKAENCCFVRTLMIKKKKATSCQKTLKRLNQSLLLTISQYDLLEKRLKFITSKPKLLDIEKSTKWKKTSHFLNAWFISIKDSKWVKFQNRPSFFIIQGNFDQVEIVLAYYRFKMY